MGELSSRDVPGKVTNCSSRSPVS